LLADRRAARAYGAPVATLRRRALLLREKNSVVAGHGERQTVIVLALVLVVGGVSYQLRRNALANEGGGITTADAASPAWTLGDLSSFKVITQQAMDAVRVGDQSTANSRADDLEHEWDVSQARLKARDNTEWTTIDGKVDTVLRQIRASKPDPSGEQGALTQLLTALG